MEATEISISNMEIADLGIQEYPMSNAVQGLIENTSTGFIEITGGNGTEDLNTIFIYCQEAGTGMQLNRPITEIFQVENRYKIGNSGQNGKRGRKNR